MRGDGERPGDPRGGGRAEPDEDDDRRRHRRGEPVPVTDRIGEAAEGGGHREAMSASGLPNSDGSNLAISAIAATPARPAARPPSQDLASPRAAPITTRAKVAEIEERPDDVLERVPGVVSPQHRERDQRREPGQAEPGDDRRPRRLRPRRRPGRDQDHRRDPDRQRPAAAKPVASKPPLAIASAMQLTATTAPLTCCGFRRCTRPSPPQAVPCRGAEKRNPRDEARQEV